MLKNYTWVFPIVGGIISIIGVLTPLATFYNYFYIWMWGLVFSRLYGISIEFINNPFIFSIGISTSILIVICSVTLIITGFLYNRSHYTDKKISKLWLSCGFIILICTVISLIIVDFYTYNGMFIYGIWEICDPSFGAIGPILGSVLAIGIGFMVLFSVAGRKEKLIPYSAIAPKKNCPYCGEILSLNATFCRKCGKSIKIDV